MTVGRNHRHAVLAALALVLAACTSTQTPPLPSVPTAARPDTGSASVMAQVDCGADGVANVTIAYGTRPVQNIVVGKDAGTLAAGGSKTVSNRYSAYPGNTDTTLTVTTSPTVGSCKTTLTDYHTRNVIAERDGAGEVVLKAVVPGGSH